MIGKEIVKKQRYIRIKLMDTTTLRRGILTQHKSKFAIDWWV